MDKIEANQLLEDIWTTLRKGAEDGHNAFHTAAFGTLGTDACRLRTVVLRRVMPGERTLFCHTDIRSEKVTELRSNSAVSWLFYSPQDKIQIRLEGRAEIHHKDELALEVWQNTSLMSRKGYTTQYAPGTLVGTPISGLPLSLIDRSPNLEESETGWPNFAVVVSLIQRFDWLYLDSKGHRRAKFEWNGSDFIGEWAIP